VGGDCDDFLSGFAGDDELESRDGVVDNDSQDGGSGSETNGDTCNSDPNPEVDCEI
jgi:hypothetical protein